MLAVAIIAYLLMKGWYAGKTDYEYAKQGKVSPRLAARYGSDGAARDATAGWGLGRHLQLAWGDHWRRRSEALLAAREAKANARPGETVGLRDQFAAAGRAVSKNRVVRTVIDPVPARRAPIVEQPPPPVEPAAGNLPPGTWTIGDDGAPQPLAPETGDPDPSPPPAPTEPGPRAPTSGDWIAAAKAAAPTCHWKPAKGIRLVREGTGAYVPMVCKSTGYATPDGQPGCGAEWEVHMRWTGTAVEVTAVTQTNPGLDPANRPAPEAVNPQDPNSNGGTPMTAPTGEVVNHETHVAELDAQIAVAQGQVDAAQAVVTSLDQTAAAIDQMQQTYTSASQAAQTKLDHTEAAGLDATTQGLASDAVDAMPPNAVNDMYDQLEEMKAKAAEKLALSEQALASLEAERAHVVAEYGELHAQVADKLGGHAGYVDSSGGTAPATSAPVGVRY